jgi:hypothetical protein
MVVAAGVEDGESSLAASRYLKGRSDAALFVCSTC